LRRETRNASRTATYGAAGPSSHGRPGHRAPRQDPLEGRNEQEERPTRPNVVLTIAGKAITGTIHSDRPARRPRPSDGHGTRARRAKPRSVDVWSIRARGAFCGPRFPGTTGEDLRELQGGRTSCSEGTEPKPHAPTAGPHLTGQVDARASGRCCRQFIERRHLQMELIPMFPSFGRTGSATSLQHPPLTQRAPTSSSGAANLHISDESRFHRACRGPCTRRKTV